ncbi:MAG: superoxide dismutase [Fe] [Chromatiales bacterium]|nr:superoxide dismutase [Fe] [Chromatiales bacterium]
MPFELPALPWKRDALVPHMSSETIDYHYGKHHQTYIDTLNRLVADRPESEMSLEELIHTASGGVFNNAAQVWNHTFFWHSLSPEGGGTPRGALAEALDRDLGGIDGFRRQFGEAAKGQFGSGWAWLVKKNGGQLAITTTGNADCPLRDGDTPLLTLDVWEHAYYVDYRNARPKYIEAFLDHLVNWSFAEANLG